MKIRKKLTASKTGVEHDGEQRAPMRTLAKKQDQGKLVFAANKGRRSRDEGRTHKDISIQFPLMPLQVRSTLSTPYCT